MSFLLCDYHFEEICPQSMSDFIMEILLDSDKEISSLKIGVNSRARLVAETFLKEF